MKAVTGKAFEQTVRLEAVKAAASVASIYETAGISNLLTHAEWISTFILEGQQPVLDTKEP